MAVIGWIAIILLALLGLVTACLAIYPFLASKVLALKHKTSRFVEDEKLDIDKRSEERKHRQEIKRHKDFELADKKLDAKLSKVNKKIKIQMEKLRLAQELEKELTGERLSVPAESHHHHHHRPEPVVEEPVEEEPEIQEPIIEPEIQQPVVEPEPEPVESPVEGE